MEGSVKIKFRQFVVVDNLDIEDRINEELKGWKITKIISLKVKSFGELVRVTLIGEVDE